jgi:anti-repressor protein
MTSTQLIPIYQNNFDSQPKQTINARDLHLFLEVQSKFADWIKARILKYEFIEKVDFTASEKTEGLNTAQNKVDYFLTLEMAKELSMVENNEKGKEARKYFIAKEREANERQIALPTTYKEALKSLVAEIEEKEKIQIELNQSKETLQNISQKKECYGFRETAKKLCVQEKSLKSYLKKKNWIMYLDEELHPTAYATGNLFATISHELNHKQNQFYPQFKITSKGFDFLANNRQEITIL